MHCGGVRSSAHGRVHKSVLEGNSRPRHYGGYIWDEANKNRTKASSISFLREDPVLKKTVTYKDFNGDEQTEELFFHLSQAELVELEVGHDGGLSAAMQRIIDTNDGAAIIKEFKNIVMMSYGRKSMDGKRFIKNQQMREEFESSEAYSTLFMELVTDAEAASSFINGIVPEGLAEQLALIEEPKAQVTMTMSEAVAQYTGQEISEKIVSGEIVIVD